MPQPNLQERSPLVEAYEEKHYPIALPNPISAIKFRMEQQGLKQSDLIPYIGSKSKVSEVLSGKRALSKQMIRALHEGLNIPLEVLIQEEERSQQEKNINKLNRLEAVCKRFLTIPDPPKSPLKRGT